MPHLSFSHCRWCTKFIKHKVEMSLNLHIDDSWWFDSLWAGSSAGDGGGEVRCCFQRWPPLTWHWWSLHPHQPHIGNHCLRRLTVVPWKPLTSTLMHVMCMSLPVKLDLENSRGMPPDFYAEPKINGGIVIISRRWQDKLTRLKCFCLVFSELELHRSRRAVYDFPFRSCIGNKRLLNFLFIWLKNQLLWLTLLAFSRAASVQSWSQFPVNLLLGTCRWVKLLPDWRCFPSSSTEFPLLTGLPLPLSE